MPKLKLKFLLVIGLILCNLIVVNAQKKVALVLSGGGAKGVCHIGLIRALEEKHIPIDYVAGTSMGAIIAGFYAAGYTPDQMQQIVESSEFQRWADGELDSEFIHFYQTEEPNSSWFKLDVDYKKAISPRIPTNIIAPYEMDFQFLEFFSDASAAANYNFDSLFVPFRCVSSDIAAQKQFVPCKGDLGNAIRASMTFPFYFQPIKIDGRLLFDGGMYNNFPVDVAIRDFKPDIIIGCKAAGDYEVPRVDDIVSQLENMLMEKTPYSIPSGQKGIVIKPNLLKVDVNNFRYSRAMIDSGYLATMKVIDSIKMLIPDTIDPEVVAAKREKFNIRKPDMFIDSIQILGLNGKLADYIRKTLKYQPKQLLLNEIKFDYFRLIADDRISYIFPKVLFNRQTGYYNLILEIKKSEKLEVQLGGNISSGIHNEGFVQFKYSYLGRNASNYTLNSYFGRFYTSVRARARYDFPVTIPYFVEFDYTYNSYDFVPLNTVFVNDIIPTTLYQNENFITARVGWPVSNKGVFKLEMAGGDLTDKYYQSNVVLRDAILDKTVFSFGLLQMSIELNSLNRKYFQTAGSRFFASLKLVNGKEEHFPGSTSADTLIFSKRHIFADLRITYDNYFTTLGRYKLGFYGDVFLSNRPFFTNYTSTVLFLPQFNPTHVSKVLFLHGFRSPAFAGVGLKNLLRITNSVDLRIEGYTFRSVRDIGQTLDQKPVYGEYLGNQAYIFSSSFVVNTVFGPISLTGSYHDKIADSWSLMLNIGFMLYNKRAME